MTGYNRPANPARLHIGHCSVTGKRQYESRRNAKIAGKVTGAGLQPFRCDSCGMWHNGHRWDLTRQDHRALAELKQSTKEDAR